MKIRKKTKKQQIKDLSLLISEGYVSFTDPQGSYTGTPLDGSQPVQDADDL